MNGLRGARVFVTGHTGFKGAWTIAMLRAMGARVTGYSLPAPTTPSLFEEAQLAQDIDHVEGDVRDLAHLAAAMADAAPDVLLHMAAQSLVLDGFADPVGTYATNVLGTANAIEAMRATNSIRAAVIVTSDKCYQPAQHALRESDPLGGHDPYAASKAGAEIVVQGYRPLLASGRSIVATVRAGNVVGGGDWSANRLVPDLARAMLGDRRVVLRHPAAVRPWQHVFDAVYGYLLVAVRALAGDAEAGRAWNFGPLEDGHLAVAGVVERFARAYGSELDVTTEPSTLPENPTLRLDAALARARLNWAPLLDADEAIASTAAFYRRRAGGAAVRDLLAEQTGALLQRVAPAAR